MRSAPIGIEIVATMFALFTAVPVAGHVIPLLRQAEELQRRGWRVAFAGAREIRDDATGAAPSVPFVDLGPLGRIADRLRDAYLRAVPDSYDAGMTRTGEALWDVWPSMYEGLVRAIGADRPDVVVADLSSTAAMSAAEGAGVPFVVNNPGLLGAIPPPILPVADHLPFPHSGRSVHEIQWWHLLMAPWTRRRIGARVAATDGRRLNRLRAASGLPPVDLRDWLRDRQILVNGAFELEYERPLPQNVAMVGVMLPAAVPPLPPDLSGWLRDGPPVVYANVDISADPDLSAIESALKEERACRVLLNRDASRLAILAHPNVRVMISDCAPGSVYEALHAGKPIVGIPLLADQRDMAIRMADAGLGVWLKKNRVTTAALRAEVQRLLRDEEHEFAVALPRLQRGLERAGGVARAADLIARQADGSRS